MVTVKTAKQKKLDQQRLEKAQNKLHIAGKEFQEDLAMSEFDFEYIRIGTISALLNSTQLVTCSLERSEQTHTYTDYEEDKDHKNYKSATPAEYYKKGGRL
tara:strand:+ start:240 stop:542 length:303 start_codon:yes stop_codon:yes gene_type:complete